MSNPYNPTNDPSGPNSYDDYHYYGREPEVRPSSPMFSSMMPDMMERTNVHHGNSAMAPPGGINLGSPMLNGLASMAMNAAFGGAVRPMSRPDMPALDYIEARERHTLSMSKAADINKMDAGLTRFGTLGDSALTQIGYDMFNPHGSQNAAFQSIYGRMGTTFGGSQGDRANKSMEMLGQMNTAFRKGNGFDYQASQGFDRGELVDATDAGLRYGIGGMSQNKLRNAVDQGRGGDVMKSQARIFAAAGDVFGKDKGMDELAQLMTKSIDGFQGLDESKATELLNKIQATSKAVNVSTKALAEYTAMMNQLYKSQGQGGASAAGRIVDASLQGKVITEIGRDTGDSSLSDLNQSMEAAGRNKADLMNSPTMRKAQVLAAMASELTPAQRAGTVEKSMTRMKAALESGDPDAVQAAVDAFEKNTQGVTGFSDVNQRAMNFSERDRMKAKREIDFDQIGALKGKKTRRRLAQDIGTSAEMDPAVMAALGGVAGLEEMMGGLNSAAEMTSRESVKAALKQTPAGQAMSEEALDKAAAAIAGGTETRIGSQYYQNAAGYESAQDLNADLAASGRRGTADTAQSRLDVAERAKAVGEARDKSGNFMRNYGFKGLIDDALNILPEMNNKEWTVENVSGALKKITGDIAGAEEITGLAYSLKDKEETIDGKQYKGVALAKKKMEMAEKKAGDVRSTVQKETGSEELAKKKAEEKFTQEAIASGASYLLGGSESPIDAANKDTKAEKEKAEAGGTTVNEKGSAKAEEAWRESALEALRAIRENTEYRLVIQSPQAPPAPAK